MFRIVRILYESMSIPIMLAISDDQPILSMILWFSYGFMKTAAVDSTPRIASMPNFSFSSGYPSPMQSPIPTFFEAATISA